MGVFLLILDILLFFVVIVLAIGLVFTLRRAKYEVEEEEEDDDEDVSEVGSEAAATATGTVRSVKSSDVAEEDVPEEDVEKFRAGSLTYNKSFLAKYIQSDDTVKEWYGKIKNELKSYEKVRERISWRRESFRVGRETVARLAIRGKTLCIYLPLNPADYAESDYRVEDASDTASFADTPCAYRIRSDQRLEYAFELIEDAMKKVGAEKGDVIEQNYYMPYESLSDLIAKGLVKRVERTM